MKPDTLKAALEEGDILRKVRDKDDIRKRDKESIWILFE
jgi:hypothetical protein